MNLFDMARKALTNDIVERVPLDLRLSVIEEMVQDLERQAKALRSKAEALIERECCNGRCNQGRKCPLRKR